MTSGQIVPPYKYGTKPLVKTGYMADINCSLKKFVFFFLQSYLILWKCSEYASGTNVCRAPLMGQEPRSQWFPPAHFGALSPWLVRLDDDREAPPPYPRPLSWRRLDSAAPQTPPQRHFFVGLAGDEHRHPSVSHDNVWSHSSQI